MNEELIAQLVAERDRLKLERDEALAKVAEMTAAMVDGHTALATAAYELDSCAPFIGREGAGDVKRAASHCRGVLEKIKPFLPTPAEPDRLVELLPCPFCGGDPELDTQQAYRALSSGRVGTRFVIYCTSCNADMGYCHEDIESSNHEATDREIIAAWNRRDHVEAKLAGVRQANIWLKDINEQMSATIAEQAAELAKLREAGAKVAGQLRVMLRDDDAPVSSYEWLMASERFVKAWDAALGGSNE